MHFDVSISKAQGTGSVVIACRVINDTDLLSVQTVVHCNGQIAVVDAVRMLIDEHIGIGVPHAVDVTHLPKNHVSGAGEMTQPVIA